MVKLFVHDLVNDLRRRRRYKFNMTIERSKTNELAASLADIQRSGNLALTGFASTRPINFANVRLMSASNLGVCGKLPKTRGAKTPVKIDVSEVTPNTPLRLEIAAQLAFPGGGIGAPGLRKEALRGKLVVERIAGKDYTTLSAIEDMRLLCRAIPKALDSGSSQPIQTSPRPGSSETEQGLSVLDSALAIATRLKNGSRLT
jgi:hypothetical protein